MEKLRLFGEKQVCTVWNEERALWYFSIVDVVGVLTDSPDPSAYWRKLKQRLKAKGNQTVTNCHGFKMIAADGKVLLALLNSSKPDAPRIMPYQPAETRCRITATTGKQHLHCPRALIPPVE
jgi:hypothetical protein